MPVDSELGTSRRALPWPAILAFAVAAFVFLKNAWVTEDAYIVFRSLDQLFAGHGPVWNPDERVQVFTSPLWYWVLAGFRLVSADYFLMAIAASAACWGAALVPLRRLLGDDLRFLLAVLLLSASSGFSDFTSSGLENPLAALVIVVYLGAAFRIADRRGDAGRALATALLAFGTALVVRHDLATLLLVPTAWLVYANAPGWSRRRRAAWVAAALAPLAAWTLFALFYYGFPFPNPAYAKLDTGIARRELIKQGLLYLRVVLRLDPATMLLVLGSIGWALRRSATGFERALQAGLLTNLVYVVAVGGDFMQGRFLFGATLIATVCLARTPRPRRSRFGSAPRLAGWTALVLYLLFFPHTPLNSPLDYWNPVFSYGVTDERGYYYREMSLLNYLRQGEGKDFRGNLPDLQAAQDPDGDVLVDFCIGMIGFFDDRDRIIIDRLGLTDPFLARLPSMPDWRPGHYGRILPEGYRERRIDGTTPLADPDLDAYYGHLEVLTRQTPLWSAGRLATILKFNLGFYDHLLSGSAAPPTSVTLDGHPNRSE